MLWSFVFQTKIYQWTFFYKGKICNSKLFGSTHIHSQVWRTVPHCRRGRWTLEITLLCTEILTYTPSMHFTTLPVILWVHLSPQLNKASTQSCEKKIIIRAWALPFAYCMRAAREKNVAPYVSRFMTIDYWICKQALTVLYNQCQCANNRGLFLIYSSSN